MNKLKYDETAIIDVLKDINDFVVSLDQIGKVHHEFGDEAWKDEIIAYLRNGNVLERLSDIRSILSEPFKNREPIADKSFLEIEMEKVSYWDYGEFLKKKEP